jgi:hypothetical protein
MSLPPTVNVLDLLLVLIERHVAITAEERMLVMWWTAPAPGDESP